MDEQTKDEIQYWIIHIIVWVWFAPVYLLNYLLERREKRCKE